MAMELTVYSLNGLLLCCLRSKYEPEVFYETKSYGTSKTLVQFTDKFINFRLTTNSDGDLVL